MRPKTLGPWPGPAVGTFITNIRFGDSVVRASAIKQSPLIGTDAIASLGDVIESGDPAAAKAAYESLKRIVYHTGRPRASDEARTATKELLKLAEKGRERMLRSDALDLIGAVANTDAIPALVALLHDADVREDARMAIQRVPGKSVDAALIAASRSVPAEFKAAINSSLKARATPMKSVGLK